MAQAAHTAAGLGLSEGEASQWPLQRYGRFMLSDTGELPGTGREAGHSASPTWKVFDSNEESGYLVLTIVISGHFFISQGQTLLNKSRMFRVQFSGESKEQALERCCSCVQSLARYITVQVPDRIVQEPQQRACGSQDSAKGLPAQRENLKQQVCEAASTGAPEGRTSVTRLAQSILVSEELPLVYEQSAWGMEELGPFLRLCLMDQNFPAFVEDVEKELKKLMGLRN